MPAHQIYLASTTTKAYGSAWTRHLFQGWTPELVPNICWAARPICTKVFSNYPELTANPLMRMKAGPSTLVWIIPENFTSHSGQEGKVFIQILFLLWWTVTWVFLLKLRWICISWETGFLCIVIHNQCRSVNSAPVALKGGCEMT